MQLTIEVPDHIAEGIGERAKLERDMLEAFAAEAYRTEKLSRRQVGDLLGLDYWDTEEFLSRREAKRPYTLADLEVNRISLNDALANDTRRRRHWPDSVFDLRWSDLNRRIDATKR